MTIDEAKALFKMYPEAKVKQVGDKYYLYPEDATKASKYTGLEIKEVTKKDLESQKKVSDA